MKQASSKYMYIFLYTYIASLALALDHGHDETMAKFILDLYLHIYRSGKIHEYIPVFACSNTYSVRFSVLDMESANLLFCSSEKFKSDMYSQYRCRDCNCNAHTYI